MKANFAMTTPKSTLKSPMDNTQRLWDIFNSILNQLLRVLRPSVEKRCSENCSFSSVSKNFQCPRQSCCLRSRTLRKYKTNNMCLRTDVLIHDHVTSKPFLLQKNGRQHSHSADSDVKTYLSENAGLSQ